VVEGLTIHARDGFHLAADLFLPRGTPRAAALVAPAMGVPRAFYAPFGSHLAESGIAALTVDYRGIGGSRNGTLRGFRAELHDWAEQDLAGALDAIASRAHQEGERVRALRDGLRRGLARALAGADLDARQHGSARPPP
jgi:predicted alpha/beta hydrolase